MRDKYTCFRRFFFRNEYSFPQRTQRGHANSCVIIHNAKEKPIAHIPLQKPASMMRVLVSLIIILCFINCKAPAAIVSKPSIQLPAAWKGDFTDDYDIRYTVSDSVWIQHPGTRYHILQYDSAGHFIVARNGAGNQSEPGLYTRIDVMSFENMEPYRWGFCLTTYDEKTMADAVAAKTADRMNPRKGCNGYPFSRMKRFPK